MAIQDSINQMLGTAAVAAGSLKHFSEQSKIAKAAEQQSAAAAEEAKKEASYGNELNKILGEELQRNPNIREEKYFNKAMDMMVSKRDMMKAQRDATRQYRNQFDPSSKEYAEAEAAGQARKEANFQDFRNALRNKKDFPQPLKYNFTENDKGIDLKSMLQNRSDKEYSFERSKYLKEGDEVLMRLYNESYALKSPDGNTLQAVKPEDREILMDYLNKGWKIDGKLPGVRKTPEKEQKILEQVEEELIKKGWSQAEILELKSQLPKDYGIKKDLKAVSKEEENPYKPDIKKDSKKKDGGGK